MRPDARGRRQKNWRFRNEQQRNAWYEDFIKRKAVQMLTSGSREDAKQVTDMLAALSSLSDKRSLRRRSPASREKLDLPNGRARKPGTSPPRRGEAACALPKDPSSRKTGEGPVYAVARYHVMAPRHNAATAELQSDRPQSAMGA